MNNRTQNFAFNIQQRHQGSNARLGELITPHGAIDTPAFIFCATKAAIKAVSPQQMRDCNTQIILSNTYHLMLHPGSDLIANFGGLHKFMGWNGPILTDSGGFQIFSLGCGSISDEIKGKRNNNKAKSLLKITEEGALFRSYINGQMYLLTPERAIEVQHHLGADLVLVFDECTPFHVEKSYTKQSMERSHRWAKRSLDTFESNNNGNQALYGIVQGGVYEDLRLASCDFNNTGNFFGQAIGGSLGSNKNQMYDIVEFTKSKLDPNKPTHLLGIGDIDDIFFGVEQGIDTFDCVHPTRIARHGGALVQQIANSLQPYERTTYKKQHHINLFNSMYKLNQDPIEHGCSCSTCKNHSKGYLHYLLKAKELLAYQLITIHNVSFMNRLMTAIRQAIKNNCLDIEKKRWLSSVS
jgi:queuine tRNA-ribosyltransferase